MEDDLEFGDPPIGELFGPYRLLRLLGRGDMGPVYEAVDTRSARSVALRILFKEFSDDPRFTTRLQRELRSTARIAEPHVVPILDSGRIDGRLCIAMRMIDGPDLATVLENQGHYPPSTAVSVVCQIGSALDAAHGFGLIHRDVKPENILVTRDDFAYLTNFGIATMDEMKMTRAGTPSDTYAYTAPELFAGDKFDHRSDIYSLTCVLFECLTGSLPFPEKGVEAKIAAHLMQPPPQPSRVRPGIAGAFDDVVARGMAKSPDDRYRSAGDLGRDAQNALAQS